MKTAIILIIIFSLMYVFGAFQEKPADPPELIRRNRTEENRKVLQAFWDACDQYMDHRELEPEAADLMRRIESALKFGFSAKELDQFRTEIKSLYKRHSMITNP
jgi:hypothetical protein